MIVNGNKLEYLYSFQQFGMNIMIITMRILCIDMGKAVHVAPPRNVLHSSDSRRKSLIKDMPNPQQAAFSTAISRISAGNGQVQTGMLEMVLVLILDVLIAGTGNARAAEARHLSTVRLRRVDLGVVLRIAHHLRGSTDLTATQLAMLCRMKYTTCRNYVDFMEALGWVTYDKYVNLTPEGLWKLK